MYKKLPTIFTFTGWDCTDNALANSWGMVLLELLLLTLSNLAFIPAVYIAYKRKYYVEAICYGSTCFFSTFYHACDAGEQILSFCLVRWSALQFGDFFTAILSVWVTLIAMAYLDEPWPKILHVSGAIGLAFGVTHKTTSLQVFLVPSAIGIFIVSLGWYLRYKQTGKLFPSKKYLTVYLPGGLFLVLIGMLCFAFFQTRKNYMYVHSSWHVLIASAILLLLPDEKVFLPTESTIS